MDLLSPASNTTGGVDPQPERFRGTAEASQERTGNSPSSSTASPPEKVPEALGIASRITPQGLLRIRETFKISPSVELVAPSAQDRAFSPPDGHGTMYLKQLEYGFRFPVHPFWVRLLSHFRLVLAQITPAGCLFITHFLGSCKRAGVAPTLILFQYLAHIKRAPRVLGWYSVSSKPEREFRIQNLDLARKWKSDFFFFCTPDAITLSEEWNFGEIPCYWDLRRPSLPESRN